MAQTDFSPADNCAPVVLNDTAVVNARALYVGTGGDLKLTVGTGTALFKAVPAGTVLPVIDPIVWATGSTAADVVALF